MKTVFERCYKPPLGPCTVFGREPEELSPAAATLEADKRHQAWCRANYQPHFDTDLNTYVRWDGTEWVPLVKELQLGR
jgi:hypothetical protein